MPLSPCRRPSAVPASGEASQLREAIESAAKLIARRARNGEKRREEKKKKREKRYIYIEREKGPLDYRRKRNIECNGGRWWRWLVAAGSLRGCPSCSQKTSRGLLSCANSVRVDSSLCRSLRWCIHVYVTYTRPREFSLPRRDSRVYIELASKRRLPDPGSRKSSRPNKNSAPRGPLSLSPPLSLSLFFSSFVSSRKERRTEKRERRGRFSAFRSLPRGGTGRGPRSDV